MKTFPELEALKRLIARKPDCARFEVLAEVEVQDHKYPIYSLVMGPEDPRTPTFGVFGGVHGLERVGSQLVLSYLDSLFEQIIWDQELQGKFKNTRLISIPIVNPVGVAKHSRSNGNGIDLMRNAPVEAKDKVAFLVGGHRYGNWLPWYRGGENSKMELESSVLVNFVKKYTRQADFSMSIDVHSGFGIRDRLWYPYAHSKEEYPRKSEMDKFRRLLDQTQPHHIYLIEPQHNHYMTHGDLWDYMFTQHLQERGLDRNPFLPLTLEMGSWMWVRKNPVQLFSSLGVFNPMKAHRYRRVMRRHKPLLELVFRAVRNYNQWLTKY